MKSLKPRLLTAVIGIPLILIFLFFAEMWTPLVSIVIGIVSAIMTYEYLSAVKLINKVGISIPCILFSFALSMLISTGYLYLLLFVFMLTVFSAMIFMHEKLTFSDISYALLGTLLVSFGMSSLSYICASGTAITFYFVVAFALPWMADAGGFFIGAAFGSHKLCPKISPKKTVEGAIGGIVFCIVSSFLIGLIFQYLVMPTVTINFWALLLIGVIDAPLSILGDLSFSLIKRNLNIKDYGSIFPGHGGMLDRFDSIIFTVPVIIAVHQFMPFITLG